MCGICGFFITDKNNAGCNMHHLTEMTKLIAHRGPDSKGYFYAENGEHTVGLGHRRLSIIDLSTSAKQPLENENGSVVVAFNGEIYNFRQLTKDLKARGHIFRSNSDTEVIIHLYEEMGERCIEKLDGMFAFALFDRMANRLLLARDRLGIKPLYYTINKYNIYFASEIKSLLFVEGVSREIDLKSLNLFFTYGYIPGDVTIFKHIKKLQPATYMSFARGKADFNTYWSFEYKSDQNISEKDLKDRLFEIVQNAVERHLVSDVPLGAFLSGGLDSSIVVAMMSKITDTRTTTFSLGYQGNGNDELDYAAAVANLYQTDHHAFRVSPDLVMVLPELIWHLDEPFFDNSILPTYYISKLAKSKVKVVLSGDGGDELFGGYEWTRRHQFIEGYQKLPSALRGVFSNNFSSNLSFEDEYGKGLISKFSRLFKDLNADLESGFMRRTSVSALFRYRFYSEELKAELNKYDNLDYRVKIFKEAIVKDERERMLFADMKSFLPDDCLYKVDRMSMAHGLEVRIPFLDQELVEFSAKIPFNYKIRGLTSKYLLKKTFSPFLPKNVLKQRKQGFTIPISQWLRGSLGRLAEKILLNDTVAKRGLFDTKQIKWMLDNHRGGSQELGHRIWSLVVFEVWAKMYLDEKITSAPKFSLEQMMI